VRVKILETGSLTKSKELAVDKTIFDSVKLLDVINYDPACFGHEDKEVSGPAGTSQCTSP
jgi:hypothetical protein